MSTPVISMSVWRRPDYTREVLDALRDCYGSSKYKLIVAVDCDGDQPSKDVLAVLGEQTWPVAMDVHIMPGHCGCNRTVGAALRSAFPEADYVIHVEDDVVLARDALCWFEWARERYRNDQSVLSITAWRHARGWLPESGQLRLLSEPYFVQREAFFTCWGWATWKDRWNEIDPQWSREDDHTLSWDVRMSALRGNRVQVAPHISRAKNVGAMLGTHRGHVPMSYWRGDDSVIDVTSFVEV